MKHIKKLYIGLAIGVMSLTLIAFGSPVKAEFYMQGTGIIMNNPDSVGPSGNNYYNNPNYNYGNYYNNSNNSGISQVSVTTVGATAVEVSSANLMGSWRTSSTSQVGTWFLYGTTMNLGSTTVTRFQNSMSGNFVDTVYNLTPNTIYYYRAASIVNGAVSYGEIRTFKTSSGVVEQTPAPAVTTTTNTSAPIINSTRSINSAPSPFFGSPIPGAVVAPVTTNPIASNKACVGDMVTYNLNYKNTTGKTVTSAMLVMAIPAEVDYVNSSADAQYNADNRTLTVFVGSMNAGQEGIVYVTGKINSQASGKDIIAARVNFTFTNPDNTNSTVTNYITHTGSSCQSNLGAFALSSGFLPTGAFGWILLAVVLCLIIFLTRKFFTNKKAEHIHMSHLEHPEH